MKRFASVTTVTFWGAFLLAWLGAFAPSAHAQGLILRGGVNFANAITDPQPASPSNREYLQGLNGALLGEFGNGPVRLILGAGYENRGMHVSGLGGGDIRLDYMTIPVMISLGSPLSSASANLFLNLGIEPGFLLASDYATDSFTFAFNRAEDFDLNLRAELGIGLPVSYSGPAILLGGGVSRSVTDADKSDNEWSNYAFHTFLGIKIRGI
jgi:hypothetical protein